MLGKSSGVRTLYSRDNSCDGGVGTWRRVCLFSRPAGCIIIRRGAAEHRKLLSLAFVRRQCARPRLQRVDLCRDMFA